MKKIKLFINDHKVLSSFVAILILVLTTSIIYFIYSYNMNTCQPGGTYRDKNGAEYVVEGSIGCYPR